MTERLDPDRNGIDRAAVLVSGGGLVAFGTETVYGLGADATDPRAVAAVFAAKNRPAFNPLIAHLPDADAAFEQVVATPLAWRLAAAFWPGPLTLVLPRRTGCTVCGLAAAGLPTLAVRVPAGPVAEALLRAVGRPVAAPSANPSGRVSPSTAAHVLAGLDGRIDAVLDSGPCRVGLESTVLDLSGPRPRLLRPGGVALEALEQMIGPVLRDGDDARLRDGKDALLHDGGDARAPSSPGQLASHYAPVLPLRLDAVDAGRHEALLAFGPAPSGAGLVWNLSERGDLDEAAARLFAGLRALDAQAGREGLSGIAAMSVPGHGLGLAIRDRLRRAAAPRSGRAP